MTVIDEATEAPPELVAEPSVRRVLLDNKPRKSCTTQ